MKTCKHCEKQYNHSTKNCCYQCYRLIKKYGKSIPDHWNKKCNHCNVKFFSKSYNVKYCMDCAYKLRLKRNLVKYRKKKSIDKEKPIKFKKPNGSGHIAKNGYVYITKVGHPNAKAKGRMFEHTFIMSQHLNRPLKKEESVHHKNGIKNDNKIENLELWTRYQPRGQRVEDKIEWAKSFLKEYGYVISRT